MNYVLLQRRENLTVWMNNVKNLTTIVLMDNVKSLTACSEKGKGEKSSESYYYRLEKREFRDHLCKVHNYWTWLYGYFYGV